MWDKLRIRERERLLGMLFIGVLVAVPSGIVLALAFPLVAQAVLVSALGICWLVALRRLVARRQGKWQAAPVGPLSPDEKLKARAKLMKAPPQNGLRSL
jgi:hypothetical protein